MNKQTFRNALGAVVASAGLFAAVAVPAGSSTVGSRTSFPVDAIMANDLHVKTLPSPVLSTGGSSFDLNLVQAAISQLNVDTPSGTVLSPYQSHSSGNGRSGAISGTYSVGFSDFPLNQGGNCDLGGSPVSGAVVPCTAYTSATGHVSDFVVVPVALGGVAIIFNLGPESTALHNGIATHGLVLSGLVLGKIWAGHITSWNDPAIKALNPSYASALPALAIHLVSRANGSGTTFVFKDYLSKVDPTDFPSTPHVTAGCTSPAEYPNSLSFCAASLVGSNSAAVDTLVSTNVGGVGYVEYSYAILNGNPTARLLNKSNKVVKLSSAAVLADATAGLAKIGPTHFSTNSLATYSINNELGATNWPICGFSYAIMPRSLTTGSAANAIATVKFLDFLAHQGGGVGPSKTFGQDLALNNGYVPTPLAVQHIARTLLLTVKFAGNPVLKSTN